MSPSVADLEASWFASQLGLSAQQLAGLSVSDLRNLFFTNPPGAGEVGYVENITGTSQSVAAGGNADVTNIALTVQPTLRPVYLEFSIRCSITAIVGTPAPVGTPATGAIYEVTGARTLVEAFGHPVAPPTTAVVLKGIVRLGPVASARSFVVNVQAPGTATNGYNLSITNAAGASSKFRAFAQ